MKKMKLNEMNILCLTRTMSLGGTENVVLQLCEILKPFVNKVIVASSGGVNVKKLENIGIRHYTLDDITDKSAKTILRNISIIRRIISNENINVIHSHHRMAAFYAELLAPKNAVLIANAHNTFQDKRGLTRFAYRHTKLIAVGQQVKNNLTQFYGIPESQVTVIHNAIKPFDIKVPVAELQAKKKGNIIIGNIGRLSEQKGMEYFIQAARIVHDVYPNTKYFIVGGGEDEEKLKALAAEMLPDHAITFLGYRTDIQNIMSQMDFIVLSSLWEGLPLTPIEAFSVRKPVIATAVDGTPEIVTDGKNGILVDARDVKQLADAVIKMCKDDKIRNQMGNEGYETFCKEFSFDKMAEKYISFYSYI